ncbi:MAG TPA: HDOD domain-containing protein [Labilithrix sp.]|nr:HDOD domain-containing protein [Labilithrix sp.]
MRILLAEATTEELLELERALFDLPDDWELYVALGAERALALLAAAPFDVVVSGLATELLPEVRCRHPEVARLALSAAPDGAAVLRTLRDAHQVLSKPCRSDLLFTALQRLEVVRSLVVDSDARAVLGAVDSLAAGSAPLAALLGDRAADLAEVSAHIAGDPGLSAKVLQIANTAFFSRGHAVVDVPTAVQRVGLDALRSALACGLFTATRRRQRVSAAVANVAASLVPAPLRGEAYTAALLCATGDLALDRGPSVADAQSAESGAYLLALWGLPGSIVRAVAAQRDSQRTVSRDGGLAVVLRVAREQVAAVAVDSLRRIDVAA